MLVVVSFFLYLKSVFVASHLVSNQKNINRCLVFFFLSLILFGHFQIYWPIKVKEYGDNVDKQIKEKRKSQVSDLK